MKNYLNFSLFHCFVSFEAIYIFPRPNKGETVPKILFLWFSIFCIQPYKGDIITLWGLCFLFAVAPKRQYKDAFT